MILHLNEEYTILILLPTDGSVMYIQLLYNKFVIKVKGYKNINQG
ncbi:MAG TPA: hypothetical protein VFF25_05170 [Clostridia bacterium]|nr:hypothetical protein [Clostridia bacterium]